MNKFLPQTVEAKNELRKEYGYIDNDFILLFSGELSYNKHQDLLIDAISLVKRTKVPNIKLLLAGVGVLSDQYKEQISRLGLEENVQILGYRKDVVSLLMMADIAVSSSRREGLPMNVMEAMATGLPLVVTDCRGNRDLVINNENGYVVGIDDVEGFADAIEKMYRSEELRDMFGRKSLELIKTYSLENVTKEMKKIYLSLLK